VKPKAPSVSIVVSETYYGEKWADVDDYLKTVTYLKKATKEQTLVAIVLS
jgi:hypothetical protein